MSKADVRAEARRRLAALTPAERAAASIAIQDRIWEVPEIAGAKSILLYASLPDEVPTDGIGEEALRRGIVVTYPRCVPATRTMTLHVLMGLTELREAGSYGIREPDLSCPLLSPAEIDAVLVPGLAWDRSGARLGRGAGYYDRLFARDDWRGFRCGLFFAAQEIPHLPLDPWDVRLDAVVTEGGVVKGEG